MRVTLLIAASVSMAMLVGAAEGAVPTPPKCSPADTQRRATLTTGAATGGYARFCGPGQALVRLAGKSFTISGGHCGRHGSARWMGFGLIATGPSATGARGLSLVLKPGDRPGRVKVIDSIVQVAGLNLSLTGAAAVVEDLDSARFVLVTKGPTPTHIAGRWTCG